MLDIRTIRDAVTPIAKEYGLKRIYLFGSYARGIAEDFYNSIKGTEVLLYEE